MKRIRRTYNRFTLTRKILQNRNSKFLKTIQIDPRNENAEQNKSKESIQGQKNHLDRLDILESVI